MRTDGYFWMVMNGKGTPQWLHPINVKCRISGDHKIGDRPPKKQQQTKQEFSRLHKRAYLIIMVRKSLENGHVKLIMTNFSIRINRIKWCRLCSLLLRVVIGWTKQMKILTTERREQPILKVKYTRMSTHNMAAYLLVKYWMCLLTSSAEVCVDPS